MVRQSTRKALILCLLVLLQEFGPAHFIGLEINPKHSELDEDEDEDEDNDAADETGLASLDQENYPQTRSKRSFKLLIKAIKWVAIGTNVIGIGSSIYYLIARCCGTKACEYRNKIIQIKKDIERKKTIAADLKLEVQNYQVSLEDAARAFEGVLREQKRISDQQELLVYLLSPNLQAKLAQTDTKVNNYVNGMKANKKAIEFLSLEGMYEGTVQKVTWLLGSLTFAALPLGRMYYKAKIQVSTKKTLQYVSSTKTVVRQTSIPSNQGAATRLKAAAANYAKTAEQVRVKQELKYRNNKYVKAYDKAVKVVKKISVALSLFTIGFQIYNLIRSIDNCNTIEGKTKKSLDKLILADRDFDQSIANLTEAKTMVVSAFKNFRDGLRNKDFAAILTNIKGLAKDINVSGKPELTKSVADIESFLTEVKSESSPGQLSNKLANLRTALQNIRLPMACLNKQAQITTYVLDGCKKGRASFDSLYSDAVAITQSSKLKCDIKTIDALTKDAMKKMLVEVANKKDSGFSASCKQNKQNDKNRKRACFLYKRKNFTAERIAAKLNLTKGVVEGLIANCK